MPFIYFEDSEFLRGCEYHKTLEKARGGIEQREYWQTDNIGWLSQKKGGAGLKSIAMTRNTITKNSQIKRKNAQYADELRDRSRTGAIVQEPNA